MPTSRTAIITDIHGNMTGLLKVMEDILRNNCKLIICLGDIVEGGKYNNEVVQFIEKQKILCVKGNHDEFNDVLLSKENTQFLNALPEEYFEEDICFTHISIRNKKYKIDNPIEAWNVFDEMTYRLLFVGHTHIPLLFGEHCNEFGSTTKHFIKENEAFYLDKTDRYIISVGAVGYSRDAIKKPRYTIYDPQEQSIEFRCIDGLVLPL